MKIKIPNPFAKKTTEDHVTLAGAAATVHNEAELITNKHLLATELGEPQKIKVEGKDYIIKDVGAGREMKPV